MKAQTKHQVLLFVLFLALPAAAFSGPEEDRLAFQAYFQTRFPDVPLSEYINGIYALDENARRQWIAIEDFPPYEFAVESGENLFRQTFSNGRNYGECFEKQGIGIRQYFPQFDPDRGEVVTLEMAINLCREQNDESPLPYDSDEMMSLSAYMAWTSRGNTIEIRIPDDPRAPVSYTHLRAHETANTNSYAVR